MSLNIAKLIRYCRRKSGLTQQQLAEMAGVGKTVVYDIEKGKITIQFNTLQKILKVLNIQITYNPPFVIPEKENN
jgi:HTH-type transcriptional regulator/antitoxin HipB